MVRTKNTLGERPTEAEFARMPRYASAYIERLERERDALRAQLAEARAPGPVLVEVLPGVFAEVTTGG